MKKTTARVLSLLMAVCCMWLLVTPAGAAEFPDVSGLSTEHWDAINYVSDNGILLGTAEGGFEPDATLTRAMAVTILYRMAGATGTYSQASQFPDVPSDKYFYNAVGWAVYCGIVTGAEDGNFYPYDTVTFQDVCVFLHRLAKASGYNRTERIGITTAQDYSSVSSYARDSVDWAYTFALNGKKSGSTWYIQPLQGVSRKTMAYCVYNYRNNVEGIKFGRDNFSFANVSCSFKSGADYTFYIAKSDYDELMDYAWNISINAKEAVSSMYTNGKFGGIDGTCYGMSLAVVLDHLGKIDLNGNICSDCSTMYALPKPSLTGDAKHFLVKDQSDSTIEITAPESRINMYQLSQAALTLTEDSWSQNITTATGLQKLVSELNYGGVGILSVNLNGLGGHCVVAYGKPVKDGTTYTVSIYDPNYPNSRATLTINAASYNWSGVLTSGGTSYSLLQCKFEGGYSYFDIFDMDGEYNVETASETEAFFSGKDIVMVQSTGDFTVTNSDGTFFDYESGETNGTMEILGQNMMVTSYAQPCVQCFLVPGGGEYAVSAAEGSEILSFDVVYAENESTEVLK